MLEPRLLKDRDNGERGASVSHLDKIFAVFLQPLLLRASCLSNEAISGMLITHVHDPRRLPPATLMK
jgi:hypothetical protein